MTDTPDRIGWLLIKQSAVMMSTGCSLRENLLVQHAFLYSPYMNTRASYVKLIGSVTAGKQLQSMASTTAEEIIIKHP